MAKEFAKAFYTSKAWQKCRASYISKRQSLDGGICEECKDNPGFIVHHKILLSPENISNPDIALNHEHLKYVCKCCHDREDIHEFIKQKKLKCVFDEYGQVIPP